MRFQNTCSLLAILFLAAAILPAGARADSAPFGYSYGSETLPKGAWELETWWTWRTGKGKGSYDALDLRQEIEYGFTDRFQAAFYLNERYHHIEDVGSPADRDQFAFQGVAAEFRYEVLNVFKDPVGFTLYAEPSYSRISKGSGKHQDEWEIEFKALLQKNFLDDQLITVLNITPAYEVGKKRGDRHWEKELGFDVTSGISYRVAPRWYLGIETRYSSKYEDFPDATDRTAWAFFVGPAVHYAADRWWATLTALPQVGGWPNDGDRSAALNLSDYERFELRLRTGISF